MKKELASLIEKLGKIDNLAPDAMQIADAIWLAQFMDIQKSEQKDDVKEEEKISSLNDQTLEKKEQHKPQNLSSEQKSFQVEKEKTQKIPLIPAVQKRQNRLSLRLPRKKEFFITDRLLKKLYPLKNFYLSHKTGKNLDENESVEFFAKNGFFVPQFTKEKNASLDLYLVLDQSPSMSIWQRSVDEFIKKLIYHKIFKSVKILYANTQNTKLELFTDRHHTRHFGEEFVNFRGNAYLFLVTDFIAPVWKKVESFHTLYVWQETLPLFVLHTLPFRMWKGTILGNTNITTLINPSFKSKNSTFTSEIDKTLEMFDETYFQDKVLKVPIVNFLQEDFGALSSFILATKENHLRGFVANFSELIFAEEGNEKIPLDAKQRVKRYCDNSSETAVDLAQYMSISTHLNFEIMKMIQHNMLPQSKQIHLAEFFVGGLLDKTKDGKFYHFYVDENGTSVRDILLDKLGEYQALVTLEKNSDFIAKELGSTLDYHIFLKNKGVIKQDLTEADRAFAYIALSVLKKVGGAYAKKANTLYKDLFEKHNKDEIQAIIPTSKRFQMGSDDGDVDEKPVHEVVFNYDFEIAKYPVTVGEFRAFVEDTGYKTEAERSDGAYVWDGKDWNMKKDAYWDNPYFEQTDEHPVVCVSWNDAKEYCKWLNEKTGENYRLPTEAEWEYSCRAGTITKWSFGDDEKELEKYAWYDEKGGRGTKPVGKKLPNPWGLYDIHGNVWEWCEDDYADSYKNTPRDGKAYVDKKSNTKVLRGGSWDYIAYDTRSANRDRNYPNYRSNYRGFRLLRTLPSDLGDF